jgi:hypothetical protein
MGHTDGQQLSVQHLEDKYSDLRRKRSRRREIGKGKAEMRKRRGYREKTGCEI